MAQPDGFASLYVESVLIENFRGLSCAIDLEPHMTLLVGRNNAGKSRVLRALTVALGGARADVDDLTVGMEQPATIDVFIAPLRKLKGAVGSHLAYAFTERYPDHATWPEPLRDLIQRLETALSEQERSDA
ncbi:MAG: AAA family ATPase [bacterium]|nr:AAA family ATPase [bacterium]